MLAKPSTTNKFSKLRQVQMVGSFNGGETELKLKTTLNELKTLKRLINIVTQSANVVMRVYMCSSAM